MFSREGRKSLIFINLVALGVMFALAVAVQATTLNYFTTTDNEFYIYLSTDPSVAGTPIGSGFNWEVSYSGSGTLTPGVTNYLHIYALDAGGPASTLGDFSLSDANFQFSNGTQALSTNTTDFFLSKNGWNAAPNVVTDYGYNGQPGITWPFISGISPTARWIWTTDNWNDDVAYLSTPITWVGAPLPGAVLLFGSGLIGLFGLKRKLS